MMNLSTTAIAINGPTHQGIADTIETSTSGAWARPSSRSSAGENGSSISVVWCMLDQRTVKRGGRFGVTGRGRGNGLGLGVGRVGGLMGPGT